MTDYGGECAEQGRVFWLPAEPKVQSPRPELQKGKSEIANTTVISSDEGAGQLAMRTFLMGG